jgi:hypothetical protein
MGPIHPLHLGDYRAEDIDEADDPDGHRVLVNDEEPATLHRAGEVK